ncbi:MAG: glycine cleavage system protein GcvH [Gammaproteobacteria bacterium]
MIDIRYAPDHSWIRLDDDGDATVGISAYAQELIGDIVYLEAPEVGREVVPGEEIGVIESALLSAELKSPVQGAVIEINHGVIEKPELLNESPIDDGWIFRLRVADEAALEELMDEEDYADYIDSLE